jgi:hypothetical protein
MKDTSKIDKGGQGLRDTGIALLLAPELAAVVHRLVPEISVPVATLVIGAAIGGASRLLFNWFKYRKPNLFKGGAEM